MLNASSAGSIALKGNILSQRQLSPAALKAASEQTRAAYSPIVLAGIVRVFECVLITLAGFGTYLAYVVPWHGFTWTYGSAIAGIAALSVIAFQAADIYQVHAFRRPVAQMARLI